MIGKKYGKCGARKFVLVESKAQFDQICCGKIYYVHQEDERKQKEEYIIVPKFEKGQRIVEAKNKALPRGYIKTIQLGGSLNNLNYELDSSDLCFITNKYPFIQEKLFIQMIVSLQRSASTLGTEINYLKLLERKANQFDLVLEPGMKEEVFRGIYNYWRNKRKNLRSPILRLLWLKTETGPFKIREESNGHCLRNRAIKVQQGAINEILRQDLLKLKEILLLMENRENLEMKLIEAQKEKFAKECKKVLKAVRKMQQEQRIVQSSEDSDFQIKTAKKVVPRDLNSLRKKPKKLQTPKQPTKSKI